MSGGAGRRPWDSGTGSGSRMSGEAGQLRGHLIIKHRETSASTLLTLQHILPASCLRSSCKASLSTPSSTTAGASRARSCRCTGRTWWSSLWSPSEPSPPPSPADSKRRMQEARPSETRRSRGARQAAGTGVPRGGRSGAVPSGWGLPAWRLLPRGGRGRVPAGLQGRMVAQGRMPAGEREHRGLVPARCPRHRERGRGRGRQGQRGWIAGRTRATALRHGLSSGRCPALCSPSYPRRARCHGWGAAAAAP